MVTYPTKKLGEVLEKNGVIPAKIKRDEYHESGKYPVVDQGENLMAGYINDEKKLYRGDLPVIVFGDHTRIVKYIDFPFAFGADGIKILRPQAILLPKFFYYTLILNPVMNQGYKRHFSLLAQIKIPLPPLAIQKQIVERLDKIAEAQKLNDDLIQKTDELFQSLLHKELNPAGKNWEVKKLKEILLPQKYKVGKLKREAYQKSGNFPIIDQSVNEIAGYSDEKDLVYSGILPVVIYGDHTRIIKFVDKPFVLGADGTKILIPKSNVLTKYLYFALHFYNVGGQGYKRHFPLLKEINIPTPPLETQKKIVAKLSAVQEYKSRLLEQKSKLKELFKSVLHKSMKNE